MNSRIGISLAVLVAIGVLSVGAQSPTTHCGVNNAACNMADDETKVVSGVDHAMASLEAAVASNDKKAIKEAVVKAKAELVEAKEKAGHARKIAQMLSDHAQKLEEARGKMREHEKSFDGLFYGTDQFIIN
jgi:hypothetical protein